jgi:hypothetical protein
LLVVAILGGHKRDGEHRKNMSAKTRAAGWFRRNHGGIAPSAHEAGYYRQFREAILPVIADRSNHSPKQFELWN